MNEYEIEIQNLEKQIIELKKKSDKLDALSEEQKFALTLYNNLSRNVDSDWYYYYEDGVPTWAGHDQTRYLTLAKILLKDYSDIPKDRLIELLSLVKRHT
jgi:hypothetical protein